ncbi:T9SS type A sorting domain-containing protein [Hymenobacter jeollabukensis]|uniref:T9SS type A sorting domain-containing protein n=1 Tax=Hymenobacter jeollabukensis TaxID=2025313 RepID=A0A5R8WU74_9BACT|nr:T9SS type A sorting domain-containing protein [Hymenobacter jeollabukensis]TLM95332.1 T9SS type A sorting domain-containing protein [Hymenobacter jeollabukensis]
MPAPILPPLLVSALVCLLSLSQLPASAQSPAAADETRCLLLPLDPARRAQAATLVVEAEVLSQRSFWNDAHRRIYTANTLRVYKLLKGQWAAAAPLTVVTEGGAVGDTLQTLTNTLRLSPGQQGLLFLTPASFAGAARPEAWAAYASRQGFVRYDVVTATANEPFRQYPLLDEAFYRAQTALTGQALRELAPNPALAAALLRRQQPAEARGVNAPLITGFSPRAIVAGADSVLTISGAGFGTAPGGVEFRNADDGGVSFTRVNARDVLSWSDARIQVRVPSYSSTADPAGSGTFRVVTADQQMATSPVLLPFTVRYALTNVQETTSGVTYRAGHINQNGAGGYTFQPDPALAPNAAALAAFGRALSNWRCQTAINWDLGSARAARGIGNDGVNALEFDQGTELPANILGRTTSTYLGCREANGNIRFWVREIDMQFDDGVSWQFGPGTPSGSQFDFETVVLHELGHGQQLNHVIAPVVGGVPQLVMHYAIGRGQLTRQLNFNRDVLGGYAVQLGSVLPGACGPASEQPAPLTAPLAAQLQNGRALLSWTTRNECSGMTFSVERSPDAQTWTRLAQVPTTGATTYTYTDGQPLGGTSFYRLQVQLANGLNLPAAPVGVRESGAALLVYPNPATGPLLTLEYNAPAASNALEVRVFDALGRYYGGQRLTVPQAGVNTLRIGLPTLRAGWYVLRWNDGGAHGTVPFVRVQ